MTIRSSSLSLCSRAPSNSDGNRPGKWGGSQSLTLQLLLYVMMFSIWGSSFFFTSLALHSFNAVTVPVLRMSLAAASLAILVGVKRLPLPRDPRIWLHVAALGALNIAVPYILLNLAQVHVNSSFASVLSATTPLFAFLFSCVLARTERFNFLRATGLLIAFCGIASLYGLEGQTPTNIGPWALVIVFSSMMFAAGNVYTRLFLHSVHPFVTAFLQIGAGTIYLVVIGMLTGTLSIGAPTTASSLAILELGTAGSALTYVLFFHFIKIWGSTAASLNTYFQPVVGVSLGVFALGERVALTTWFSLLIVLLGVLIFGIGTMFSMRQR